MKGYQPEESVYKQAPPDCGSSVYKRKCFHNCKYLRGNVNGVICHKKDYFCGCHSYGVDDKDNHCEMFEPEPNEYDKIREEVRRETAKEIFTKLDGVAKNFSDTIPLTILRLWAIEFGAIEFGEDTNHIKGVSE